MCSNEKLGTELVWGRNDWKQNIFALDQYRLIALDGSWPPAPSTFLAHPRATDWVVPSTIVLARSTRAVATGSREMKNKQTNS